MNRPILSCIALTVALAVVLVSGCAGPDQVRLDRSRLHAIDAVVDSQIEEGNIPGAVVCVGQGSDILYLKAFGHEITTPHSEPMNRNTVFDLASLTKPLATACSILVLVDQGRLHLDDPVSKYLPDFAAGNKGDVRIRHLLGHSSGLPAYTNAASIEKQFGPNCPDRVIEKICSLQAQNPPDEKFVYSCLGYITLGRIIEIVSGMEVARFADRHIFQPMGLERTRYLPPDAWKSDIAATELQADGLPLRGVVHDPLARLMSGVSGNAGLFSTAEDLAVFCRMLLNDGMHRRRRILSKSAVRLLTTPQAFGRAYGFGVSSSYSWIKGQYAPPGAFCHSGYTGTSIVCDPDTRIYVIILTNRAHPKDAGTTKPTRVGIADIVFQAAGLPSNTQPKDHNG